MRKLTDVIASDLVGSRVDNQLPLLMAEGSKAGAVVTVANSEAIYAGNIEFHLGHELFDQPKASKEPCRANLLGLMGRDGPVAERFGLHEKPCRSRQGRTGMDPRRVKVSSGEKS